MAYYNYFYNCLVQDIYFEFLKGVPSVRVSVQDRGVCTLWSYCIFVLLRAKRRKKKPKITHF